MTTAIDAIGNFNRIIRTAAEYLFNAEAVQSDGIGGSGGDYRATATVAIAQAVTGGWIIGRFISDFDELTDTKTGIVTQFGLGGWPETLQTSVADLNGATIAGVNSASNLVAGTTYTALFWYISDAYYQRVFVDQTHTVQNAIDDSEGDGGVTVYPAGDDVIQSNPVTIAGVTTPATSIVFSGSITTGAQGGSIAGSASANRSNGTWSIPTQQSDTLTIDPTTGIVSVASGKTVGLPGTYAFTLRYDNAGVTGGGAFSRAVTLQITEATVSTPRFLAQPTINANSSGRNLSIAALKALVDGLKSNWGSAAASLGLAQAGVDAVLRLAPGALGEINWSGVGPFRDANGNARYVHIRGAVGSYGANGHIPTCGTTVLDINLTNCEGLRFWGLARKTTDNTRSSLLAGTTKNIRFNRMHWGGDEMAEPDGSAPGNGSIFTVTGTISDIEWRQCTFQGWEDSVFKIPNDNTSLTNFRFKECLTSQNKKDFFSVGGSKSKKLYNFVIEDFYFGGIWRCGDIPNYPSGGSEGPHLDFLQCQQSGGDANGWTINGLYMPWLPFRGETGNQGGKVFQKGGSDTSRNDMRNFTVTQVMTMGGPMGSGGPLASTITYCDGVATIDVPQEWGSGRPAGPAAAKNNPFGTMVAYGNTVENCFVISSQNVSAGRNGLLVQDTSILRFGDAGANWNDGHGAYLEHFNAPSSQPTTDPAVSQTDAVPRRQHGIGQWKPKVGTQWHYDHANPKGAYQFKRRIYEPAATGGDNPNYWGWPTCVLFAAAYDEEELTGGAAQNAVRAGFDADGNTPGVIVLSSWTQSTETEPFLFEFDAGSVAVGQVVYIEAHDDDTAYPGRGNGFFGSFATTPLVTGENVFTFTNQLDIPPEYSDVAFWATIGAPGQSEVIGGPEFSVSAGSVTPVLRSSHISGTNSGVLSFDAENTTYESGDLILVGIGNDYDRAQIEPVRLFSTADVANRGPNDEVATYLNLSPGVPSNTFSNTVGGANGTSITIAQYVAAAQRATNAALWRVKVGQAQSDQFTVPALAFEAGTFRATNPVELMGTTAGDASGPLVSSAFTAPAANGRVVVFGCGDVNAIDGTSAGWTVLEMVDHGAIVGFLAIRDAATTEGESVSAGSWSMSSGDGWVAATLFIHPGVS